MDALAVKILMLIWWEPIRGIVTWATGGCYNCNSLLSQFRPKCSSVPSFSGQPQTFFGPTSLDIHPSICWWHLPKYFQNLIEKGHYVTFKPLARLKNHLLSLKDSKDLFLDSRVYKMLFSCGVPYIEEIGHSFNTIIHEHVSNIKHEWTQKLALAKHSSAPKHHICLESTQILSKEAI